MDFAAQGRACVLAVVLEADGSTPCKAGAKAVIDGAGVLLTTVDLRHVTVSVDVRMSVLVFDLAHHDIVLRMHDPTDLA